MRNCYFDNAATSFPKAPGVGEAMCRYVERLGRNVGRGSYAPAMEAAGGVLAVREKLAALVGAPDPRNIIFTPGATWGLNLLLRGLLRPGDRVITSPMEHNAVLRPLEQLRAAGVTVELLPCTDRGELVLDGLAEKLPGARAVALTHASNVSGTLFPIAQVGALCRQAGVFFLVDGAQTLGVLPVDVAAMGIDGLAFPGHKGLLGPQGIGGLALSPALAQALERNPTAEGGAELKALERGIRLENVSFGYEPGKDVLRGISAELRAGGAYAVVGGSGSGKSAWAEGLACRLAQGPKYYLATMQPEVPATLRAHYQQLSANAGDCVGCKACEARCPFGVPVASRMEKAAKLLG